MSVLAFPKVTPNLTTRIHFLNYPVSFAAAQAGVSQRFPSLGGIACPPLPPRVPIFLLGWLNDGFIATLPYVTSKLSCGHAQHTLFLMKRQSHWSLHRHLFNGNEYVVKSNVDFLLFVGRYCSDESCYVHCRFLGHFCASRTGLKRRKREKQIG